jgi:group II intron reverse transcriptase/maturase
MNTTTLPYIKRNQIRLVLKKKYYPIILRSLAPIQGIRKRSDLNKYSDTLLPENKFYKLFSLLHKEEILIQALGNISTNKGALTKGTNNFTIDGINLKRIKNLSKSIKSGTFQFKPFRRIRIEKPVKKGEKKKYRPLGIPNFEDRIVQEAIRMILEAIYEPIFNLYNYNYGFRTARSAQQAIEKIKNTGTACSYAIEGDIKGAFDNVDFNILLNTLKKRIGDKKFLRFIEQGLKCGLIEKGHYEDTLTGVPQGGIASPILFNIYMHEFDMYIHNQIATFIQDKNISEKRVAKGATNPLYKKFAQRITRNRTSLNKLFPENTDFPSLPSSIQAKIKIYHKKLKTDSKLRAGTPSVDSFKRNVRILYVRYADDFIILTNGSHKFSNQITNKISQFLKNELKLELSKEKTKITNLKENKANFLGFSIFTYRQPKVGVKDNVYVRTSGYQILIGIDMDRMLNRLLTKSFCRVNDYRPIAKSSLSVLSLKQIISTYNSIIRGTANYFMPLLSIKKDIIRTIYILEYSAYMTIAKKFGTKISKIREKYGKPLTITVTEVQSGKNLPKPITTTTPLTLLSYLRTKELVERMMDYQRRHPSEKYEISSDIFNPLYKINWRTLRNLNSACCVCGSTEKVEMHHIHQIRKGKVEGFAQVMKQINRKQIPLCRPHHLAVEAGKLNDIKATDLYFLDQFLA